MPRFQSDRDRAFIQGVNSELIDTVIETPVVIYKQSLSETKTNIYGEGTRKAFLPGVNVTCLIERQETAPASYGFGQDTTQSSKFKFQRQTLANANVYPEPGDFIFFNTGYYEIDNANEEQLVGGQPGPGAISIVCETHLTRKAILNIEENPIL
jgi:hypothetical protein